MKILYLEWPCYCGEDVKIYFNRNGHEFYEFAHEDYGKRISDSFLSESGDLIKNNNFDLAFSFNYFPILAEACHEHGLTYVSVVFDSPYSKLYSNTAFYDTNYIFHFDSFEVEALRGLGVKNIYHTLLPVLSDKIPVFLEEDHVAADFMADVSFMGCLYNEEYNLFDEVMVADSSVGNRLKKVVDAQMFDYRGAIMKELLSDKLLEDTQAIVNFKPSFGSFETVPYVVENYVLARKVTSLERLAMLERMGREFGEDYEVRLYTRDSDFSMAGVNNLGPADYYMDMPYVFYYSRINLNLSSRSIHSGIPLRCIDVMGSGGFLMSNYQNDLVSHFTDGVDFVCFDSLDELVDKASFYLKHDDERLRIAEHGYHTARELCQYEVIFDRIFEVVFSSRS